MNISTPALSAATASFMLSGCAGSEIVKNSADQYRPNWQMVESDEDFVLASEIYEGETHIITDWASSGFLGWMHNKEAELNKALRSCGQPIRSGGESFDEAAARIQFKKLHFYFNHHASYIFECPEQVEVLQ